MSLLTVYLTPDAEAYLKLYCPKTYGIEMPRKIAQELMDAKFIEWVPAPAWSGTIYGQTEAGARYQDEFLGGPKP